MFITDQLKRPRFPFAMAAGAILADQRLHARIIRRLARQGRSRSAASGHQHRRPGRRRDDAPRGGRERSHPRQHSRSDPARNSGRAAGRSDGERTLERFPIARHRTGVSAKRRKGTRRHGEREDEQYHRLHDSSHAGSSRGITHRTPQQASRKNFDLVSIACAPSNNTVPVSGGRTPPPASWRR